jgi:hypothetical protein
MLPRLIKDIRIKLKKTRRLILEDVKYTIVLKNVSYFYNAFTIMPIVDIPENIVYDLKLSIFNIKNLNY